MRFGEGGEGLVVRGRWERGGVGVGEGEETGEDVAPELGVGGGWPARLGAGMEEEGRGMLREVGGSLEFFVGGAFVKVPAKRTGGERTVSERERERRAPIRGPLTIHLRPRPAALPIPPSQRAARPSGGQPG